MVNHVQSRVRTGGLTASWLNKQERLTVYEKVFKRTYVLSKQAEKGKRKMHIYAIWRAR
jgi:hypothetical protein